jgi:hypothetical protein
MLKAVAGRPVAAERQQSATACANCDTSDTFATVVSLLTPFVFLMAS